MKFKQRLKNNLSPLEAGYTIIESLVAMIMVATLMAAIAPVIAYSVGTRVQARRVELAAQAGRSYIDGVRSGVIEPPDWLQISPSTENTSAPTGGNLTCPNDGEYCGDVGGQNGQLFCIDGGDGGGCQTSSNVDMVVQAGRYHPSSIDAGSGYQLLVRVYRADAFSESGTLNRELPSTNVTNAVGNRTSPLSQLVTEISPTDNSFQNLRDRLEE